MIMSWLIFYGISFADFCFKIQLTWEWFGRLAWNEKETKMCIEWMLGQLHDLMHDLDLDFQDQILKCPYLRNGRVGWHVTQGMWVDGMLDTMWPWIVTLHFQG